MSHEQLIDVALAYYEALDTPLSLSCAILLAHAEWDQLTEKVIEPDQYNSAPLYRLDVCATDFLRKLDSAPTSFDREKTCMDKWWEAEQQCFQTNRRINYVLDGFDPSTKISDLFASLRKIVHNYLGRPPNIGAFARFGPGSTLRHKGRRSLIPDKIASTPEMTEKAWIFLRTWSETSWARSLTGQLFCTDPPQFDIELPLVRGNRWVSVPKDGKTNRAIAIEPTFNGYFQLGLGQAMRSSLNRQGLLLSNAQEVHRDLARKSSIDGSLATIDLSNASDTICYSLVRGVVPDDWFSLIDAVRSPFTLLPCGKNVRLEKFSSMGNGYTFELETTIFASICHLVAERLNVTLETGVNFSVFGDDIIVPTAIAQELIDALILFGFKANPRKTFITGPFRESCGGDFFNGMSVRPVLQKDNPTSPPDWISIHNRIWSVLGEAGKDVYDKIISYLPSHLRSVAGPEFLGDLVLHGTHALGRSKVKDCIRYVRAVLPLTESYSLDRWDCDTAIASIVYGVTSNKVTPRDSVIGYRVQWVAVP